jgi:hypothetical protein
VGLSWAGCTWTETWEARQVKTAGVPAKAPLHEAA